MGRRNIPSSWHPGNSGIDHISTGAVGVMLLFLAPAYQVRDISLYVHALHCTCLGQIFPGKFLGHLSNKPITMVKNITSAAII